MGKNLIKKPGSRESVQIRIFLAAGICFLAVSLVSLLRQGVLSRNLWCAEGRKMALEAALFFAWMLYVCCLAGTRRAKTGGIGLGILAGIWCHQVFLPFLISGLWLFGLLLLGDRIRRFADPAEEENGFFGGQREAAGWLFKLTVDLTAGFGSWISLICMLSACGFGGLNKIRLTAAVLMLLLYGEAAWRQIRRRTSLKMELQAEKTRPAYAPKMDRAAGLLTAVILTMVFIQAARINLWPDYDSLHYGLRSHYILDAGRGIYENLGNINLVYTYPKGFEVLAFPLSGTATFGYTLCLNLWLTVLVLVLVYALTVRIGGSRNLGRLAAAAVSAVPGVMNMAITAKSDTVTLVCQLGILCAAVEILLEADPEKRWKWFGAAVGSCLLSYAMKPTAVVFSTVLSFSCLVFLLKKHAFSGEVPQKGKGPVCRVCLACILPAAGACFGTWLRTYRMTGVPTTSVFTSIWERLGFQVRWPYAFSSIPDQGLELGFLESLRFLLKRLWGVLAAPEGEDMLHVVIAWGTSSMLLFLFAWLLWGRKAGKRSKSRAEETAFACVRAAALAIGVISLASMYLLWQVDGNYFMLMYVLLAVIGVYAVGRLGWKRRSIRLLACGFFLFQAAVTMATSWSGSVGFTPVKLANPGYYPHQQQIYEKKCEEGNQAIWSILSQDPRTRVIAFGTHPDVLLFPCNVQSYYDVTGSGGNVRLVKTLENFKEFLRFAQIQYVYVQAGYLEEGTRAYDVVLFLIQEGSLADIRYENGNLLACVNLDGQMETDPDRAAAEFEIIIREAGKH